MPKKRGRAVLVCQIVAFAALALAAFSGRQPPAHAQTAQNTAADQRRDDHIDSLTDSVTRNSNSIVKQWDAINAIKQQNAELSAKLDAYHTEAQAGHNAGNWLNETSLLGILTSIGLTVRGNFRKRKGDAEPEE